MLGAREVTMVIGGGRLVLGARWQVYTVEVVKRRHLHGTGVRRLVCYKP